ncbi:hypothetical protein JAAARDRAFT_184405 [Jaapia argillacea MUCL 33604]|uniref:ER transporter 6TM N-terminal domain-containing protein n=1 Tax=Jaapia argillacea MUCL 33604 TaxID=933084 RepID=A0A067PBT2_9AGAM|nr:hypothetical protein JAAARDRAFT_184405 [Jaapia argillacea MUCL 33604]
MAQEDVEPHDPPVQPAPTTPTFWDRLPPWVSTNLRSTKSLKLLFRCWLASWVAFIIMLPQKSLSALGQAAFFAMLVSIMLPPNAPVQMFLFMISTLVIGVLLGWAVGAAAMAASLAARNEVLLKQAYEKVQQSAAGLANPDQLYQLDIFKGYFLDVRSSVVFGVFLGFSSFLFALIRAYAPRLMFMSVFASIAVDIYCSYGVLFPFSYYNLLNIVLIPVACYIAIALVVITFVFPETVNHASLESTVTLLRHLQGIVKSQNEILEIDDLEKLATGSPLRMKIVGARAAAVGMQQLLAAKMKFIDVEFSFGRWNGGDVKDLQEPLLGVVIRVVGLQAFARVIGHPLNRSRPSSTESFPRLTSGTDGESSTPPLPSPNSRSADTYLLQQLYQQHASAESQYSVTLQDILPVLQESTAELRESCINGLGKAAECLESVNTRRWKRSDDVAAKGRELDEAIESLRAALEGFRTTKRKMLLEPYSSLLGKYDMYPDNPNPGALPLRSLHIAFVFASNLISAADGTLTLMEAIRETMEKRKRCRLWAPGGFRAIWKVLKDRSVSGDDQALGEDEAISEDGNEDSDEYGDAAGSKKEVEKTYRMDPDSRPPTNTFQRVMHYIHYGYKWTRTPAASFAVKYAILTVALWLPAVFHTSAYFNYVQKGLWALIMGQMTLNVYASDQIANYATRLSGTLFGLAFGLCAWYIGSGHGHGNPYGVAASTAVFLLPVLFLRLFAPPQYLSGVIMGGATFVLIVGYSWIDGHLPTVGNPGVGWPVAWKRWVLVVIGCVASFVLMMLPPKSGRKAVRLRNASTINRMSRIYAFLISTWITDPGTPTRTSLQDPAASGSAHVKPWILEFRGDVLKLAEKLQALKQMTAVAKWEGSVRGKWPSEEYNRLVDVQFDMIGSLSQFGGALGHLDDNWRMSFIKHTKMVNPNFISDVLSVFSLVSQSLRTGEPMHEVMPQTLLERLFYHNHHHLPSDSENNKELSTMFLVERLETLDYMWYATALVAMFELLTSLDELHSIVRGLCGEITLKGFDRWREEYRRMNDKVV